MGHSRIILSAEQLEKIVSDLAINIRETYKNKSNCVALVILEGARFFAEDLLKKVDLPLPVEYLRASSYSGIYSSNSVKIDNDNSLKEKFQGKHILLIDDIYDTGLTLWHILRWIANCQPESIKTCVLLEKEIKHAKKIDIDFIGTTIEDAFVIGYGLDFEGHYRQLPFIGELSPDIIKQHDPLSKT